VSNAFSRSRWLVGAAAALLLVGGCAQQPPAAVPTATGMVAASSSAAAACTNASVLYGWTIHRLARQTLVVPVQETDVAAVTSEVADGVGGVILFGNTAPTDLGSDIAALRARALGGIAPLIMTDEEGGAVQRMANLVGSMPSAREMGATMTPTEIRALAHKVGLRMHAAGVTMDLAPVLDLDGGAGPNSTDAIGTRSFSTNPTRAAADGLAFAGGLREVSVIPVAKHFPGLGSATGNTDLRPASTLPWTTLQQAGLLPFTSAVHAAIPAIMVSNAAVPGLTTRPASLSPAVITGVLRTDLQFRGLLMTDSLTAGGVSGRGWPLTSAAFTALIAGADMLLFNASTSSVAAVTDQIVEAIVSAVLSGKLSRIRLENAARHVLTAKHVDLCA
jgi:beta-N-acetylhexosaminidase